MERKTVKKSFRFTSSEWKSIVLKCESINITPTQYIQQLAVGGRVAKRDCHKELKLLACEIAKVGNNINQIARHLNQGGVFDMEGLSELMKIERTLNGLLP